MRLVVAVFALFVSSFPLYSQHAVDPTQGFHRLICLVHLTGSGQKGDEIKPDYMPSVATSREGIIAWGMQLTDDGKMAIVQYVAVNRHAFDTIFADTRPEIKVFEIGKDKPEVIEAFMRGHKKDFKLADLRVVAR
jgi:hypothetical protein